MLSVMLSSAVLTTVIGASQPPVARTENVKETHHGTTVQDPYRWLENWDDPAVKEWSRAQNEFARQYLDSLPNVEQIRARITELMNEQMVSHSGLEWAGENLFAIRYQPPKQQAFLVVMNSWDKPEAARSLVDPNVMDPSGLTHIDWYIPSPDGKTVAVSLSRAGTESGDVHFFDVASGKQVFGVIEKVNGGTAGGDIAWTNDSKAIYYTRYPRPGDNHADEPDFWQTLWYHKLGDDPSKDRFEIGEGFPKIAEIQLDVHPTKGWVLATVQDGDGGQFAHYLKDDSGSWRQLTDYGDRMIQVVFGPGEDLFVLSRKDAPKGKLYRVPASGLNHSKMSGEKVIIPEGDFVIVDSFMESSTIVPTDSRLFVTMQKGGPSAVHVYDFSGEEIAVLGDESVSAVSQICALNGDDVLVRTDSYLEPSRWDYFAVGTSRPQKTALSTKTGITFNDCEVVREFAKSKDGTSVPISIIRKKGISLDGNNPVLLTGYGGYGVNNSPRFSSTTRLWLEQGGVYAIANIRGGGEFGEEWHHEGNLTHKQNVFDDFAACMRHMIDRRYTRSEKLAITGGSNGGLLMGAMITQHPLLSRCVVSRVGIYDMLRVELSPNGLFNITEFGTVKKPDEFKALYAYSPYHRVKDGIAYPSILFTTGENDPRVDPMQSRKMTARLQAANSSSNPILLRTSSNAGHGGGSSLNQRIEESTDIYAFIFNELQVPFEAARSR